MNYRQIAYELLITGIQSVRPDQLIKNSIRCSQNSLIVHDQIFNLSEIRNIYMIGAGKASALMAQSLEAVLGSIISGGHVVTKYGHSIPLKFIEVSEAGHPVPDENGLKSTARIVSIVQEAGINDLVICLLSGGGSSLLTDVPEQCTLADLAIINNLLLSSGADISEMNCVRKHLSKIKGGQLAKIAFPAKVISLILSDVIGDPIDVIASGPTAPDNSTFADALDVLLRYDLIVEVPPSILQILNDGMQGRQSETLKSVDLSASQIFNFVIGNNLLALKSTKIKAESLGFTTHIETSTLSGSVEDVAPYLVETALKWQREKGPEKICLLFGGEPTIKITGKGLGGRNQHLALMCAGLLRNHKGITILSAGTDGTDGPTDAAGAVVDDLTFENSERLNLKIDEYLRNCDSTHFFQEVGGLITTGPTQTNVMDMIIVLIG